MGVRIAVPDDAARIAQIYGHYVDTTWISFEETAPGVAEMQRRLEAGLAVLPWLVFDAGEVAGFAYAGRHKERAAYRWSVDTTVYVDAREHRRGVGSALYARLIEIIRLQGYRSAYAGIALPNDKSVALHRSLGFEPLGVFQEVGFKFGAWRDVAWSRLQLNAVEGAIAEPIPFAEVRGRL